MIGTIRTFWKGFGLQRAITHVALVALTVAALYAGTLYWPTAGMIFIGTEVFGYLCAFLLAATLLIGPLNLLRKRFNPVNIDLRRDTGIWSALTGMAHVVFAILRDTRGNILMLFLSRQGGLLLDANGISNDLGLLAFILLILLLVLSNQFSLRKLKGKRWKLIQRFNYLLVPLAFLHTFIYERLSGRERPFVDAVALAVFALLIAQFIGVNTYQKRKAEQLRR
ncbi:MAG TPA: ferric reductase-like transmembrane domain-containing protein [Phototrophicaceae bacterium]|nr:ferric reductase-like transmembrane domain-containing protein [Phototrophicaceae bacterium]